MSGNRAEPGKRWTAEAVRELGLRMDARTYFSVIGVSDRTGYELIRQGRTPTTPLRLGNKWVFATQPVLEWLGVVDEPSHPTRTPLAAVPDPPEAA
ncbi:hypothetical protein RB614_40420 [Phytohabitans sp. ZYX-F-186]|uniref:Helix-turn-helix domain-containing protein n=1 Tax=Phytohabitans maris TaxID=3071409 RepID=A0ABU0ZX39_9ACTN|nr:hypothetical protein [Phytohabitans sp. ZYX-F-186]MDQ7910775.1 hypothetical protein [Phytohabitans sp. ZYX-F-186]